MPTNIKPAVWRVTKAESVNTNRTILFGVRRLYQRRLLDEARAVASGHL
jgi:hypothetical protein